MVKTGRPVGRPPKPVEQKIAEGNPGKRRLPKPKVIDESKKSLFVPPVPPFSLGVEGKEYWTYLWTEGQTWLKTADALLMQMLCETYEETAAMRRSLFLGSEGFGEDRLYKMSNGAKSSSPLVVQVKDNRAQMTAWLSELGFSPTARARLGIHEVSEDDPIAKLMKAKEERRKKAEELKAEAERESGDDFDKQ